MALRIGQRVLWQWFPKGPREPYEYVPAVVVRETAARVLLEVPLRKSPGTVRRWARREFVIEMEVD